MIIKKQFTEKYMLTMDMDLCHEVHKARNGNYNIKLENHKLVGQNISRHSDGHDYEIVSVHQQWYTGWYIGLLLVRNQSHNFIHWENISCIEPLIVKSIEETKLRYFLTPKIEII
jgi:hypothetical protein